jgi:hypothetical protein
LKSFIHKALDKECFGTDRYWQILELLEKESLTASDWASLGYTTENTIWASYVNCTGQIKKVPMYLKELCA